MLLLLSRAGAAAVAAATAAAATAANVVGAVVAILAATGTEVRGLFLQLSVLLLLLVANRS